MIHNDRVQQIAANTGKTPELAACEAAIDGCKQLYPKVLSHRYNLMKHLQRAAISVDGQMVAVNQLSDSARILLSLVPSKRHPGELDVPFTQALACIWTRIEATAVKRALPKIMELSKVWAVSFSNYCVRSRSVCVACA